MESHVQNILRKRVCFVNLFLRIQFHNSRNFSINDNADEKPIFLVGQHDIAIIKECEKDNDLNNDERTRQFTDFIRVVVKGGTGGDGCVAFNRGKFESKVPPSGGNGGRGGNVIFVASPNHSSLHSVLRTINASRGQNGKGHMQHGSAGKNLIIPVPLGTIVREFVPQPNKNQLEKVDYEGRMNNNENLDEETKLAKKRAKTWVHYPRYDEKNTLNSFFLEAEKMMEEEERYNRPFKTEEKLNLDLSIPDAQYVVAQGGSGGKGNPHFLTNANRSPKYATKGEEGRIRYLELELKTIADAGLVGLPNAGKSTFLTAVSNAHPKIAPYPFTTLNPYIGTVDYSDRFQLTIADIPGLIQGAHKNVGLGHSFLRHIERSKVLVYVIDLSKNKPWEDWNSLQNELEKYRSGLTKRPSLIVANKADITEKAKKNLPIFETILKEKEQEIVIVPVSAKYKKNIVKVTTLLRQIVEKVREKEELP
ncbi:GTP-binding protein Obg/CgtA [Rhizophagus irregularis]|uniref:GTP-binding protein Obg/CgtA n=2 Tax=Rhizophagus irregularis TaxID=588596 RepID=A0A2N0PVL1_9GLOM|nr:P-loop containing nucleoside triphosphate hydrolase protein [Rhizophagus irregularis DAOM 181602=DAOM 197198]PKC10868.1 GTP-binding protein Obg/CgtA [Rhizophagus irregularis]POG72376.1 P-loop containing nucleoside triphosphate hydrolase protein [Rhizophagus irregularis DAOM 181602=DAOM 197198]|eukprot:XP_025179242.1 P-loop containing nucleoside triphosphate hydrolase protein [Rhizophagus irregularis DAOM 181602=DAOM 197198]